MRRSPQPAAARPPITDSPWLWAALFTGVGLAALLATGGKFGRRQANIENKYVARSAVASGQVEPDPDGEKAKVGGRPPVYSTPETTMIPLWPLEIILGAIVLVSAVMLLRERLGETAEVSSTDDDDTELHR